jgi:hypothetical protein
MGYILNLLKKKTCHGPPQTLSSETFKILGLLNLYYSNIYFDIFISATMVGAKQWFEKEDKTIQIFFCGIKINLRTLFAYFYHSESCYFLHNYVYF